MAKDTHHVHPVVPAGPTTSVVLHGRAEPCALAWDRLPVAERRAAHIVVGMLVRSVPCVRRAFEPVLAEIFEVRVQIALGSRGVVEQQPYERGEAGVRHGVGDS